MKKLTILWMMMLTMSLSANAMMSMSKIRENARFLTDRMAYELNLSAMQYDDVYEVNFDFIENVRYVMDDVVHGYAPAIDRYYRCLDYRNDDLRWILSASQYRRFMGIDYFCRPVDVVANNWMFRIYRVYSDVHHFYFGKPHHYKSYKGGHYRTHYGHESFYKTHRMDHYKHEFYRGDVRQVRKSGHFSSHSGVKLGPKAGHHPDAVQTNTNRRQEVKMQSKKRESSLKEKRDEGRKSEKNIRGNSRSESRGIRQDGRCAAYGR